MRNQTVSSLFGVLALSTVVLAQSPGSGEAQKSPPLAGSTAAKSAAPATKEVKPPAPSLEELLDKALRNNPDVRVAEAKVHEAEAELNRSRLQVSQKIITLYHELSSQKNYVEEAEQRYKTQLKLYNGGHGATTSQEDLRAAQAHVERAKAKQAALEAESSSLVGKLPLLALSFTQMKISEITLPPGAPGWSVAFSPDGILLPMADGSVRFSSSYCASCHASTGTQLALRAWLSNQLGCPALPLVAKGTSRIHTNLDKAAQTEQAQGAMADKIRKALDKPITLKLHEASLQDVLKAIELQIPGIPLHRPINFDTVGNKVSFQFENLSLGACLEAVEDSFQLNGPLRFAVRDYGILVTIYDLPRGAVLLLDFWKGRSDSKAATTAGSGLEANPPVGLEGTVKAVDMQNGMLTISLGSDAGIRPGHTLEVFRTKPEPKYMGKMQIISVRPDEAVGKIVSEGRDKVEVGDRVTSTRMSGR